ncbi:MAG TPA: hypothetical protein VGB14_11480 [Acidimicrobiales bacterium]
MTHRVPRLAAAALAIGLLATACGDDAGDGPSAASEQTTTTTAHEAEDHTATATGAAGTQTGAAELRAGLTALLTEHVYLAGGATGTAITSGLDSAETEAATAALDDNSQALADAVGSIYGDEAGEQFLSLWRAHIGFFVDYTAARAGGDDAAAEQAMADLDGYREDFGAFLASANPNLTKEAVADELAPHVQSLTAAIDAQVAGDPAAFGLLREAAGHMPMTAATLAGAFAEQFPEQF